MTFNVYKIASELSATLILHTTSVENKTKIKNALEMAYMEGQKEMSKIKANQDMVDGYMDGFAEDRLEYPESLSNRGASYKHGWMNGRDDRIHKHAQTFMF